MILTIINQKGGVSKSTTAHAIGTGLKLKGYKVLLVDLEPQADLTFFTGVTGNISTADLLLNKHTAKEAILHTEQADIIPGSKALSVVNETIGNNAEILKEVLKPIEAAYDFIIIDTPPTLGSLTINALTASDKAIITANADILSIKAIGDLKETLEAVTTYTNSSLKVLGILITRYDARATLNNKMAETLKAAAEAVNAEAFNTFTRENVSIREAQAMQQSIFTYAPKSHGAEDYNNLINEILERINTND